MGKMGAACLILPPCPVTEISTFLCGQIRCCPPVQGTSTEVPLVKEVIMFTGNKVLGMGQGGKSKDYANKGKGGSLTGGAKKVISNWQ